MSLTNPRGAEMRKSCTIVGWSYESAYRELIALHIGLQITAEERYVDAPDSSLEQPSSLCRTMLPSVRIFP